MLAYHLVPEEFNKRNLNADRIEELAKKLFYFNKENFNDKSKEFLNWENLNDYTQNFYRGCILIIYDGILEMQEMSE